MPEADEPTFTYTVTADVTDTTGETRTGTRAVRVGYAALQATLAADRWQSTGKPVKLIVSTQTLDGEGRAVKGTVKVHRLKAPAAVRRPDILGRGDRPQPWLRGRGGGPAPAPSPDPSDPRSWELGEVVATLPFTTDDAGSQQLTAKLGQGAYRALLETADRFGKPVTARHDLTVLDTDAKTLALPVPNLVAASAWSLEPGRAFSAVWGRGTPPAGRSSRSNTAARSFRRTGQNRGGRRSRFRRRSPRRCGAGLRSG